MSLLSNEDCAYLENTRRNLSLQWASAMDVAGYPPAVAARGEDVVEFNLMIGATSKAEKNRNYISNQ